VTVRKEVSRGTILRGHGALNYLLPVTWGTLGRQSDPILLVPHHLQQGTTLAENENA
jgi:hypothetical protein